MSLKIFARRTLHRSMRFIAAHTIFSANRRVRSVGFDVLGEHQRLLLHAPPQGETFVVHAGDEWISRGLFLTGQYDFDKFTAAFQALTEHRPTSRPKVLIDVGANIGSICIAAVSRGYVERAVAVEPDPRNSRLLRANVALNGLEDMIRTVETAAGAADGQTLELELSETNLGDHRIRVSGADGRMGEAGRQVVQVACSRLDTICAGEDSEDVLIWMDVQGFEGIVLTGSQSFLARRVPMVLEFSPYLMARANSFSALTSSLAGYTGFLNLDNPKGIQPIRELKELYEELGEDQAFTDILVL